VEMSNAGALDEPMVKVGGVMLQVMCRLSRLGVDGPLEQVKFSVPEPCSTPPVGLTGVKMKLADCPARIVAVFPVLPPPGVVESMVTGNWVVVSPFCPAAPGRFAKSLGALITAFDGTVIVWSIATMVTVVVPPGNETLRMIGFAEVAWRAPGNGPKTKKRNCGVSLQVLLLPLHGLLSGSNDEARFRSTKFPVTPLPASCEALRLNVSPITGALLTGSSAAT